jgi:hypothetical protein
MPEITTVTTVDVLGELPEIVPWKNSLVENDAIDLLVCCAGFEERSVAILTDLKSCQVRTALIVLYPTNSQENQPSFEDFQRLDSSTERIELPYARESFLHRLRTELMRWRDKDVRVVVDLSAMASYVVYRTLWALWEQLPQARLSVYFAEAGDYAPTREDWEAFYASVPNPNDNLSMAERYEQTYFQTRGVEETYESDTFPGRNVDPLATDVIAIPNFSLHRMKSMLAFAESQYNVRESNVRWYLGQPPDRVRNGWRFQALACLFNVRHEGVGVSTRDYREILQRLDALWEELHTERHLVIASLGSKMQHLGTFLFLAMHRECGLILCEPREFIAGNYSTGIGPRWWLDFGTVSKLRRILESRGELDFVWP